MRAPGRPRARRTRRSVARALAEGRPRRPGSTWPRRRSTTTSPSSSSSTDLDQMRAAHERAVACLTDALPHLDPPGRRIEIPFEGTRLVGVLRVPVRRRARTRVVLMLPGLDSTKEELGSTEQTFLDRGLATFTSTVPARARRSTTCRSAATGRRCEVIWEALEQPARGRPPPARRLGRQPRGLLRAARRRGPRRPGPRLRRRWPGPSTSASAGTGCPSSPATRSGAAPARPTTTRRGRDRPARSTWTAVAATTWSPRC